MCFYLMLVLWTLDYSAVLLTRESGENEFGFPIKVLSTLLGMDKKVRGVDD